MGRWMDGYKMHKRWILDARLRFGMGDFALQFGLEFGNGVDG